MTKIVSIIGSYIDDDVFFVVAWLQIDDEAMFYDDARRALGW